MATTTTMRKVSVPTILLLLAVLSCLFLVHAAAAADGNRRFLMSREAADDNRHALFDRQTVLPAMAEKAAVGGEPQLADEETTRDYPTPGANPRHDPPPPPSLM